MTSSSSKHKTESTTIKASSSPPKASSLPPKASSASPKASSASVAHKAAPVESSTARATPASKSTTVPPPTSTAVTLDHSTFSTSTAVNKTAIFETPALTTTFTPPPECTSHRLTMLESDAYRIWLNEPEPVPKSTFSSCYPPQFMTSYLAEKADTAIPAFSPLVCPDNYHTVFQQSFTDRPLYIACCPQDFTLAPPLTSTPGRPAYGGTCFSNIMTVSVTQYDNSSSSGVTLFAPTATTNQAYAHPIDGFAMAAATTTADANASANTGASAAASDTTTTTEHSPGIISGIAVGGVVAIGLCLTAIWLCLRTRRRRQAQRPPRQFPRTEGRSSFTEDRTLIAFPYGDPNHRYSGGSSTDPRKVSEMNSSLAWVQELPPRNAARHELAQPPQELPTILTPKLPQEPEPAVVPPPPPRSPNRDLWGRHPATPYRHNSLTRLPAAPGGDPDILHIHPPPMPSRSDTSSAPRPLHAPRLPTPLRSHAPPQRGSHRSSTNSKRSTRSSSSGSSAVSRDSPASPGWRDRRLEELSPISPTTSMREYPGRRQ